MYHQVKVSTLFFFFFFLKKSKNDIFSPKKQKGLFTTNELYPTKGATEIEEIVKIGNIYVKQ
jgi:hypothetical protein